MLKGLHYKLKAIVKNHKEQQQHLKPNKKQLENLRGKSECSQSGRYHAVNPLMGVALMCVFMSGKRKGEESDYPWN